MLGHQGDFEAEINCCNIRLSDRFTTFMVSVLCLVTVKAMCRDSFQAGSQMEFLARQEEYGKWKGSRRRGDGALVRNSTPIRSSITRLNEENVKKRLRSHLFSHCDLVISFFSAFFFGTPI